MPAPLEPSNDWSTRRTKGSSARRLLDAASQRESAKQEVIRSSNWQTPIIVDVVLGSIVFIIGTVLAITWQPVSGGAIGAAGATYVALALRRRTQWAARRRELETGGANDPAHAQSRTGGS